MVSSPPTSTSLKPSSSGSSNGTTPSLTTGNAAASVFGVTLSHREANDRGTPHHHPPSSSGSPSHSKVKPMQPPSSPFAVKLRSTSIHNSSSGNSTNDSAADVSSRDERASSVPRDIEMSGGFEKNQNQPSSSSGSGGKAHHARASPGKRPKSVNEPQMLSGGGFDKRNGRLAKKDGNHGKEDKKNRPLPPPKKPGLANIVDKPSPPPKPSNVQKSPSKPLPKPPIGHLKKNTDFNRQRTGSTPDSSRESTPSLEADNEGQKSRSHSFNPLGEIGSRVSDGFLEETLKALDDRSRGHSDTVTSTSSWVVIDESTSGVGVAGKAGSKGTTSGVPIKKTLPKTPPRVKSPESIGSPSASDGSKSPSVNALRSRFGDLSSPPTSPASPLSKTPGKNVHVRNNSLCGLNCFKSFANFVGHADLELLVHVALLHKFSPMKFCVYNRCKLRAAESLTTEILSAKLCFRAEFDKIVKYLCYLMINVMFCDCR